jgi:hypothetical protein
MLALFVAIVGLTAVVLAVRSSERSALYIPPVELTPVVDTARLIRALARHKTAVNVLTRRADDASHEVTALESNLRRRAEQVDRLQAVNTRLEGAVRSRDAEIARLRASVELYAGLNAERVQEVAARMERESLEKIALQDALDIVVDPEPVGPPPPVLRKACARTRSLKPGELPSSEPVAALG